MISAKSHRSREILAAVGRAYPSAWRQAEAFRAARGRDLPGWPQWCYLPLHGAYAIVSGRENNRVPFEKVHHVAIVGSLAAWRMGQQIIRYDETLYRSLVETPVSGDLPVDLLYRLPAWCLYIETLDLRWMERTVHGFFVHLDWDQRREGHPHHELRLLLDTADSPETALDASRGMIPVPLILGQGTITESLDRVMASDANELAKLGRTIPPGTKSTSVIAEALAPLISLSLYLCSEKPDWDLEPPKNPPTVRIKQGFRTFPASQPRIWDVGVRLGAALRSARATKSESVGVHAGPRGHIRRAHWHTYLTEAGRSMRILKWLSPILVNLDAIEDLPATINIVSGKRE